MQKKLNDGIDKLESDSKSQIDNFSDVENTEDEPVQLSDVENTEDESVELSDVKNQEKKI